MYSLRSIYYGTEEVVHIEISKRPKHLTLFVNNGGSTSNHRTTKHVQRQATTLLAKRKEKEKRQATTSPKETILIFPRPGLGNLNLCLRISWDACQPARAKQPRTHGEGKGGRGRGKGRALTGSSLDWRSCAGAEGEPGKREGKGEQAMGA